MAVTFDRVQLTKVTAAALSAHDTAEAEYQKAVAAFKADHLAEWKRGDGMRRLRDYLSAQLKKGTAPSMRQARAAVTNGSDIEGVFYREPDQYAIRDNVTKPPKRLTPAELTETRALAAVLAAATGDTISANELKLLGLKNLAPVFIAAGAAEGEVAG